MMKSVILAAVLVIFWFGYLSAAPSDKGLCPCSKSEKLDQACCSKLRLCCKNSAKGKWGNQANQNLILKEVSGSTKDSLKDLELNKKISAPENELDGTGESDNDDQKKRVKRFRRYIQTDAAPVIEEQQSLDEPEQKTGIGHAHSNENGHYHGDGHDHSVEQSDAAVQNEITVTSTDAVLGLTLRDILKHSHTNAVEGLRKLFPKISHVLDKYSKELQTIEKELRAALSTAEPQESLDIEDELLSQKEKMREIELANGNPDANDDEVKEIPSLDDELSKTDEQKANELGVFERSPVGDDQKADESVNFEQSPVVDEQKAFELANVDEQDVLESVNVEQVVEQNADDAANLEQIHAVVYGQAAKENVNQPDLETAENDNQERAADPGLVEPSPQVDPRNDAEIA